MLTRFVFVNRNLLLVNEGSLIPCKHGFNFSSKLQSNKLPAHIFLCQLFPLWSIWSTPGPAWKPCPLPESLQTLPFVFKLISSLSLRGGWIWCTVVPDRKMPLPHRFFAGLWWKGWHVTGSSAALCRELDMIKISQANSLQFPDFSSTY